MKKLLVLVIYATGIVLLEANPVEPATLEVRPPGSIGTLGDGDVYPSIQAAIDDAAEGWTVTVHAGVYEGDTVGPDGHLVIDKANLTLRSADGTDNTFINVANGVGIDIRAGAVNFVLGGADSNGFTITGGADTTFVIQLTNAPSGVEISHNTIDTTGNASMGISVGAAGAADLTISNNDFVADSGDGCIWGPRLVDLTISDNAFDGGAYAIQTSGVTSSSLSLISGNVITAFDGSGGIVICNGEATSDLSITGNTITGCTSAIRFAEYCAQGSPGDMTTVIIEDNTLSTNDIGIRIGDGVHVLASNFTIQNNCITGNTTGLDNQHATELVTAELNAWGDASGPYHPVTNTSGLGNEVSDNVDYYPWYPDCTFTTLVYKPVHNVTLDAYYDTIQGAIDEANPGDLIEADAGTYPEYLHITTDDLTIQGAGIDQSIIDLDGLLPYWHYPGSGSYASRAGVHISGYGSPDEIVENVTFKGFTVKNAGLNPPTPYPEFIDNGNGQDSVRGLTVANGKTILIQNCKVENSGYNGIGVGKARLTTLKQSEGVTIDNCTSSDNWETGISVGDYVGAITITNNTCSNNKRPHPDPESGREYSGKGIEVAGKSSSLSISGVISDNICSNNGFEGIVLKNYADGVIIEDNTVTGHNIDDDGAGIFFYGKSSTPANCKNHIIRNNTVTGNIRGIVAYYAQECTIEGNIITTDSGTFAPGQGAIKLDGSNNIEVKDNTISCDGVGIKVQKTWNDVDCYDNTFTGNTINGAEFAGIYISDGAHDNTFTDNTITGTTILTRWVGEDYEQTEGDGVLIADDAGTGNVFNCNKIYNNAEYGMENQTATSVDATYNWWGSASGPGGVGGGSGDEVSANVDFFPWLLSEDCEDSTQVVADFVVDDNWVGLFDFTQVFVGDTDYYISLNAFDTIQGAVDAASDGNSISVADGNYVGAIVNEDLTIIGANPGGSVITSGVPYKDGSSLETAFRLDADADGTEIKNFTVDCNAADNFYFAIFSRAANDVVVDSLTVNDPVQGITNYGGSNWQITNNLINYTEAAGGGGIAIYLGAYPPDYTVLNGNIVRGNTITATATAPTFTCPGISMGLDLRYGRYGSLTGNEDISYNMIVNNDITGTGAASEVGIEIGVIGLKGDPDKIAATLGLIHDNTVRNNVIDNTDWGIYFYTVTDLRVLGNELIDCNEGIHMKDGHTGIAINYNAIYGSASYGLNNNTDEVVDAELNWWGDISGPNDLDGTSETDGVTCYDVSVMQNADGLGDTVTQNADYCPWLMAPVSPSDNPYMAGDLNYDGCVDFRDVAILALNWLEGCE